MLAVSYIYRYTYDDIDTTDLLGMGFIYIWTIMIPFWCGYNHLHPSSKMGMNMNKTHIWIIDYHCTCSKGCSWVGAQFTEQRTCVSSPRAVPKSAPAAPYLPNWLETDPRMASVRSSPFFFFFFFSFQPLLHPGCQLEGTPKISSP